MPAPAAASRCAVGSSKTRKRAGERKARASASRWRCPPEDEPALLADVRVEPARQRVDPVEDTRPAQRLAQLFVVGARTGDAQVLADARREEVRILAREQDRPADVFLAVLAHVPSVQENAPPVGVAEAHEAVRERRLPRAARADEGDRAARRERELDPVEDRRPRLTQAHGERLGAELASGGSERGRW